MTISKSVEDKIYGLHKKDKEQLEIIKGSNKRLLVEAPAGYGKTRTMISKLAYILAKEKLPNPKKILALTFSINAAIKIKKEVNETLPKILENNTNIIRSVNSKVSISNYHGFCRNILQKYGHLYDERLTAINNLHSIDDSKVEDLIDMNISLSYNESQKIADFNDAIKNRNEDYIKEHESYYINKVLNNFLPNGFIPYNAILVLGLKLFNDYQEVLKFYQAYFSYIIVDEFQDTNILSWELLKKLITDKHCLLLMGDSLQRIYGFIGAIPNLLDIAKEEMDLINIQLKTNHRFAGKTELLLLDNNIRKNAENPVNPMIEENLSKNIYCALNQSDEAEWVYNKITELKRKDKDSKVAILVKQRDVNTKKILSVLDDKKLNYFYALFSEQDVEYKKFHNLCSKKFHQIIQKHGRFNKIIKKSLMGELEYLKEENQIYSGLFYLLDSFIDEVFNKFNFLDPNERIEFIKEVFENNSLKQQMEYIDQDIIISTVHGAKGLEWDYVILPDMEQYSFPNWPGLCSICNFRNNIIEGNRCKINWDSKSVNDNFYEKFLEELSVFYVAVTRARKKVYFSFSNLRLTNKDPKRAYMSCFLNLEGIESKIMQV